MDFHKNEECWFDGGLLSQVVSCKNTSIESKTGVSKTHKVKVNVSLFNAGDDFRRFQTKA